jgi:hypothetical protein
MTSIAELRRLAEALALLDELERLRRWQDEAIQVDDEWQQVWEAAGRPGLLGQSKALAVAEWIKERQP